MAKIYLGQIPLTVTLIYDGYWLNVYEELIYRTGWHYDPVAFSENISGRMGNWPLLENAFGVTSVLTGYSGSILNPGSPSTMHYSGAVSIGSYNPPAYRGWNNDTSHIETKRTINVSDTSYSSAEGQVQHAVHGSWRSLSTEVGDVYGTQEQSVLQFMDEKAREIAKKAGMMNLSLPASLQNMLIRSLMAEASEDLQAAHTPKTEYEWTKELVLDESSGRWAGEAELTGSLSWMRKVAKIVNIRIYYDDTTEKVLPMVYDADGNLPDAEWDAYDKAVKAHDKVLASWLVTVVSSAELPSSEVVLTRPNATMNLTDSELQKVSDQWWKQVVETVRQAESKHKALIDNQKKAYDQSGSELTFDEWLKDAWSAGKTKVEEASDSTLWSSVGNTLGSALGWVGDTVREWGPSGILATYAGVTAINKTKALPSWVWFGGAALVAVLVLK